LAESWAGTINLVKEVIEDLQVFGAFEIAKLNLAAKVAGDIAMVVGSDEDSMTALVLCEMV
jgi:hypothetical protein